MLPGDLSEAQEFAQSKGQAQKQGRTGVRFADVAGCEPLLAELKDVVEVSVFDTSIATHTHFGLARPARALRRLRQCLHGSKAA